MPSLIRRAASYVRPSGEPAPFSDQLEPCIFYRVTPVAGPLIGLGLLVLTLLVVAATALTTGDVAWLALVSGVGTGAFCALLPRTAGLWPAPNRSRTWKSRWTAGWVGTLDSSSGSADGPSGRARGTIPSPASSVDGRPNRTAR